MARETTLTAKLRTERGKGPARRLRVQGMLPAVLYGGDKEAVSLALEKRALDHLLHSQGAHSIIDLHIESPDGPVKEQAMLLEFQRDPVTQHLLHADLIRIQAGQQIHVHVEVTGVGAPIGVREGGILERPAREVEIRCLPGDIPEHIEVDIGALALNHSVRAGDLTLSSNLHLITDPGVVLFHVAAPRAVAVAEPKAEEAEAEEAEPEVIGGKKEAKEAEES